MQIDTASQNDVAPRAMGRIEHALLAWLDSVLIPAMVRKYLAEMGTTMQGVIQ